MVKLRGLHRTWSERVVHDSFTIFADFRTRQKIETGRLKAGAAGQRDEGFIESRAGRGRLAEDGASGKYTESVKFVIACFFPRKNGIGYTHSLLDLKFHRWFVILDIVFLFFPTERKVRFGRNLFGS